MTILDKMVVSLLPIAFMLLIFSASSEKQWFRMAVFTSIVTILGLLDLVWLH